MNSIEKIKKSIIAYLKDLGLKSSFISYAVLNIVRLFLYGLNSITSTFQEAKGLRSDFKKAGLNNYKLGREMLFENNLRAAKFRFFLANIFRPNSPIIMHHIALVYFEENNIRKSLEFIQKVLKLRKNFKPTIELFKKIDIKV